MGKDGSLPISLLPPPPYLDETKASENLSENNMSKYKTQQLLSCAIEYHDGDRLGQPVVDSAPERETNRPIREIRASASVNVLGAFFV